MNTTNTKRKISRRSSSKYWKQYWYSYPIGILATFQLIMTFGTIAMEIGNTIVDLFRANIFSGFWSFPFMLSATLATYVSICTNKTQTKAIIALVLQLISILILLIVISFLIAFFATNFTLCFGFQCSHISPTYFSSSTYILLKQLFISFELVCIIIFIILSIIYIILYIKSYKKLSHINPLSVQNRQLSKCSISTISYNRLDQIRILSSSTVAYNGAQKICPSCKYISSYIPQGNIFECPKCEYQSSLVEHAQQW